MGKKNGKSGNLNGQKNVDRLHELVGKPKIPEGKEAKRGKDKKFTQIKANLFFEEILYENELEVRMAKLLHERGIKFEYSKPFPTKKRGRPNIREVDFWLPDGPIEIKLLKVTPKSPEGTIKTQAIEVKTSYRKNPRNERQQAELRRAGIITFIAARLQIEYWEKHGLLKDEKK